MTRDEAISLMKNGWEITIRSDRTDRMMEWLIRKGLPNFVMSTLVGSPVNCHTFYFYTEEQARYFSDKWSYLDQECGCHTKGLVQRSRL